MPSVTMWKTDHQRCLLIVEKGKLSEGTTVVRTQCRESADEAVMLAIGWGIDVGVPDKIQPQRSATRDEVAEPARRLRRA
jgi:hypothetical protein